MSLYVRPNGVYSYKFEVDGVRFRGSTGATSKRAAEDVERLKKKEALKRIDTAAAQRTEPITVNVAFDRFWVEVADLEYTGNWRKTVMTSLGWLKDRLGASTLIKDIGPNLITETIAARRAMPGKKKGSLVANATVNRTVTELLRNVVRRAADKWEQPVQKIDWNRFMLSEPIERVRELRDHEETTLLDEMRSDYIPALQFKMISGERLNELVNLKWTDIDETAKNISLVGKGDKAATIPLTAEMMAIISTQRGNHPVYVFTFLAPRTTKNPRTGKTYIKGQRYPITYSGLSTAWRRYGATALQDFHLHDCRHTAATRLLRATGNLRLVQKLMRHQDITTTIKYAHADDEDLRQGMEAVAASRRASHKNRPRIVPAAGAAGTK